MQYRFGDIAQQGGVFLGRTRQIVIEKPRLIPNIEIIEKFPIFKLGRAENGSKDASTAFVKGLEKVLASTVSTLMGLVGIGEAHAADLDSISACGLQIYNPELEKQIFLSRKLTEDMWKNDGVHTTSNPQSNASSKPLLFLAPNRTSNTLACRLNSKLIFSNMRDYTIYGTGAGFIAAKFPGAVVGSLSGAVIGSLVGAFQARDEQNVCKRNAMKTTDLKQSFNSSSHSNSLSCRLDSGLIFSNMRSFTSGGATGGAMLAGGPGAVTGALSGLVAGSLVGALQASSKQNACKRNAMKTMELKQNLNPSSHSNSSSCKLSSELVFSNMRDYAVSEAITGTMGGGR